MFEQNNKNGDNKVLIKVKGDFIDKSDRFDSVIIRDHKYVRESTLQKIFFISSLIVNMILIYQFIKL